MANIEKFWLCIKKAHFFAVYKTYAVKWHRYLFFRGMIQTQNGGHHGNEKKNNPQNGFINRRGTGR